MTAEDELNMNYKSMPTAHFTKAKFMTCAKKSSNSSQLCDKTT